MQPSAETTPSGAPGPEVATVSFVSLGCPKNLVDSEKMLGLLAQDGLVPVSYDPADPEGSLAAADAVVVNTCGFLEASKEESLGVIKEAVRLKGTGRLKRVVVAGCLVQRHRARMLEWAPGIDAMVGVFDRDKIVEAVRGPRGTAFPGGASRAPNAMEASDGPKFWIAANALAAARDLGLATAGLTVNGKDGKGIGYFEDDSARLRLTPRHYAYLRVSEGCNQNCAFCTIPGIRGKMRSKPLDRIAAETRELVLDGAFEINLIGQDTTSYGDDLGGLAGGLPGMLETVCRAVEETAGQGWVRLMYAYPSNFTDAMIDAFAALAARGILLPYIDIPLQHASDRILSLMRRNVTAAQQESLLHTLRARIPGMAIRTTFISGFPGETEDDHKRLLEFVERSAFDALGDFEYSREEGTVAGTMESDPALAVPPETKARRRAEVMELQQKVAFAKAASLASAFDERKPRSGAQLDVLIDAPTPSRSLRTAGVGAGGRLYVGRARFQAPQIDSVTFVHAREKLAPGEVVRCTVVASDGYDLIARPTAELDTRIGLKVLV